MDQKETPVPSTVAKDGRRAHGADKEGLSTHRAEFQSDLWQRLLNSLSAQRLGAYGLDGAAPSVVLARYLYNMALSEALYSPLHLCEVALRNRLHGFLGGFAGRPDWFTPGVIPLTAWARQEVDRAVDRVSTDDKLELPGRVVAELSFGFWTSLFEGHYEQVARIWPRGIRTVFPCLVKSGHRRKEIKARLERVRALRNRVFHHERILHWVDLDEQHTSLHLLISWVCPESLRLAKQVDRFGEVRARGLNPWLDKVNHFGWPP